MKTAALIFSLCLLLLSCTKEVDLNIPVVESRLSLDAKLAVGDSIRILAGTSSSILDEEEPAADNQNLLYLYRDQEVIDTLRPRPYFNYMPNIYTYHSRHLPQAGHEYRVVSERSGYETAFGTDFTPKPPVISDWAVDTLKKRISFTIEDDVTEKDFYMMEVYAESGPGIKSNIYYITSYDPTMIMLYSAGDLEDGGSSGRRGVLSDEYFNGKQKYVEVYYDSTLYHNEEYIFQLSSISKEYYLHERSRSVGRDSDLQIFSDRANLFSNVVNGYGVVICQNPTRRKFVP